MSVQITNPIPLTPSMIKNGYYQVGDQIFANKIPALIEGSKKNIHPTWIFNQQIFNNTDWSTEPQLPIGHLYRKRARYIRSKYDYVILLYTAGVDSQTVFDSFSQIGIPVDEIFITWPVSAANKIIVDPRDRSSHNAVAEWTFLIKPQLDLIKQLYPKIKITVVDSSKQLVENEYSEDDIFLLDNFINLAGLNRWPQAYDELRKIVEKHPNSIVISGHDKPQLRVKKNKLYLYFVDTTTNLKSQPDIDIEFFYWSPDATELLRKQCHLVLKYFQERPNLISCLNIRNDTLLYHINTAIYPFFDPRRYQASKQKSVLFNEQFAWIWDTSEIKNSLIPDRWHSHVHSLNTVIESRYYRHYDGKFDGYVGFVTPDYYIGDLLKK